MNVLVTAAGHRRGVDADVAARGHHAIGVDIKASPFTTMSFDRDRRFVSSAWRMSMPWSTQRRCTSLTWRRIPADFVDTNVTGTLNLLEEARASGAGSLSLRARRRVRATLIAHSAPAAWITEDVVPVPRNIYG